MMRYFYKVLQSWFRYFLYCSMEDNHPAAPLKTWISHLLHITAILIGAQAAQAYSILRQIWITGLFLISAIISSQIFLLSPYVVCLLFFQVNMQRIYLANCLVRPTLSIYVPTHSRTESTAWLSKSHSWTPPQRKVSQRVRLSPVFPVLNGSVLHWKVHASFSYVPFVPLSSSFCG